MAVSSGPLTFGQLSLWRSVQHLPRERRHEGNLATVWTLPDGSSADAVTEAWHELQARHPSLHTIYRLSDPQEPQQVLHPHASRVDISTVQTAAGGRDAEEEARRVVAALATEPFDLTSQYSFRVRVLEHRGRATHVAMVHHHLGADGMGKAILWDDLTAMLAGREPRTPAYSLIGLAEEQRSATGAARHRAAVRHWEKIFTASAARNAPLAGAEAGAETETLQVCLRSRRSRAAAAVLANRWELSVPTLALTAYVAAVADVQKVRSLPMWLLSANRFTPRWERCVSTVNQWTPTHVEATPEAGFAELARLLHRRGLQAYRHGMYNPDAMAEVRGRFPDRAAKVEHLWAVNHIIDPFSADSVVADGRAEAALTWEPVFQALGPRFYLRITDNGRDSWALRLRARGLARDDLACMVRRVHEVLIAEAQRAEPADAA